MIRTLIPSIFQDSANQPISMGEESQKVKLTVGSRSLHAPLTMLNVGAIVSNFIKFHRININHTLSCHIISTNFQFPLAGRVVRFGVMCMA